MKIVNIFYHDGEEQGQSNDDKVDHDNCKLKYEFTYHLTKFRIWEMKEM